MKISEATYKQLNELVQKSFDCNARADNFAYNIDYLQYPNIGSVYHNSFAHLFSALADKITDLMIKLNARPIRKELKDYDAAYLKLYPLFVDSDAMVEEYRLAIKSVIDVADLHNDYEVRIAMENFLIEFLPYVKQSDIWRTIAEKYKNNEIDLEVHFKELTTFITIQNN